MRDINGLYSLVLLKEFGEKIGLSNFMNLGEKENTVWS